VVDRYAENGRELGADQRAALIGVLTSGRTIDVIAAPAGTGKSFLGGAIADAWSTGRVIGLAPSQAAAQVLTDEGVTSWNLTAWRAAVQRGDRDAIPRAGDLFLLDEAGMASTPDIAHVVERVRSADAKVIPIGDPRQLGAVGPGGVLGDLAARGGVYELTDVRRFDNAWEGQASLRLRGGDPVALGQYDRHGRIVDAATGDEAIERASRAWLADTLAGKESLLIVGTNAEAAQASAGLRAQLVSLGHVEERGTLLDRDGCFAGVGDRVQARRNGWDLLGVNGNERAPINRETYRVTELRDDGSMTVVDSGGTSLILPAQYVSKDLALAYATTVHGAQGRTVDTGHAVTDGRTDAGSVYVSLTRGRESNTAWVVTRPLPSQAPTGEVPGPGVKPEQPGIEPRSGRAILAEVLERAQDERGALAEIEQSEADARSAVTTVDRLIDGIRVSTADRTAGLLDGLVHDGTLSQADRERLGGESALGPIDRMLRAGEIAGRDASEVLREAIADKPFTGSRSTVHVLYGRVRGLIGEVADRGTALTSFHDLIPAGLSEGTRRYLADQADASDARRHALGSEAAANPPAWAVERLGPVPDDPLARADWETRVGWAMAWRENQRAEDGADPNISGDGPLGAAPPVGLAEKRSVWVTALAGLGGPDAAPEEAGMTDARLRARVAAGERERIWAPAYVADQLAATAIEKAKQEADATVWGAHGGTGETATAAAQARAEAERLEMLRADLAETDEARARWFAHTAVTREKETRARAVLNARGADPDASRERVSGAEWLRADEEARVVEDQRRVIGESEVVDRTAEAARATPTTAPEALAASPETGRTDIRQTATTDDSERVQPAREVPEKDPTTERVTHAREALDEIADRHSLDENDDADEQMPWWVGLDDDTADDDAEWAGAGS